jgi:hypothetical protein
VRPALPLLILALSLSPACRKKAEPEPPPAPEPEPVAEREPEPAAPSCPARDALIGTWYLVTEVSPDVGKPMAGINGYYTLDVKPRDIECSAQVNLLKRGWGRGENKTAQSLEGRANIKEEGRYWKVPIAVGSGADRTDMVLWLRISAGSLQGYWHYTNASWGTAPLFGVVEGRRALFEGKPTQLPAAEASLGSCALKGKTQVTYDTCPPSN